MKNKGIIKFFAILVFFGFLVVSSASAATPTITLITPSHGTVLVPGIVNFVYNVTSNYDLINCSLWTNETGTFSLIEVDNTVTNGTNLFTREYTSRKIINWNIRCYDEITFAWGTARTLYINNPPVWLMPLPSQTVNEDSDAQSINLADFVSDADFDNLTFSIAEKNASKVDCYINGTLLYFKPAQNYFGSASCKVRVSDGISVADTTLQITVNPIPDAPIINDITNQTVTVNQAFSLQVDAYDPDGDSLTYTLVQKPEGMSITSTGLITWTPTRTGSFLVIVQVSDGTYTTTKQFYVNVVVPRKLEIYNVEVTVDGSRDSSVGSGDIITVKPESQVSVKVSLKNMYTSSERITIKNVVLRITAVGIDDGEDIEEETSEFNIRYNTIVSKTIDFKIPLKVDEQEYDLVIRAEGKDENGYDQVAEMTIKLSVDKKNHDVRIRSLTLMPEEISCDRTVILETRIINLGSSYEDKAGLSIESQQLKILRRENFELSNDPFDEDSERRFSHQFIIPDDVKAGTYSIIVRTYYNTDILNDQKTVQLTVRDCAATITPTPTQTATPTPTQTIVVETPTPTVTAVPITEEKKFTETTEYILLLIAVIVIVVALIIILLVRLFLRR
ncbi:MAG: Ig-like domain-containing protein [Candidatus Woesearchaeota archaeon]